MESHLEICAFKCRGKRSLQGSLQSIRRFISQLADRAQPFNMNLHKGVKCVWNEECQKSLDQIKKYLANPPILIPLSQGNHLCYTF